MNRRLSLCMILIALVSATFAAPVKSQVAVNNVIVIDFFDDVVRVNNGSVTNLFDVKKLDNIQHIAIADSTTAFVVNFQEIWKLDMKANTVTLFAEVEGVTPSEITMDINGDLLVSSSSLGVVRYDTTTGVQTLVYDDSLFDPSDITVSAEGFIYVTEFFDGLGRINPGGSWTKIGDWPDNFFSHVDIGADGLLYAASRDDKDIYQINPFSGNGTVIAEDVFVVIDDLQVDLFNTIYIAGNRNVDDDDPAEDVVLSISQKNFLPTVVVDENMVGNPKPPFFNPMDIYIFDDTFYSSAAGDFAPTSIEVNRGTLSDGTVESLRQDDDIDLSIQRSTTDVQSVTELEIVAFSHTAVPTSFELTYDSSVFARTEVTQTISLFNYDTNEFEVVDSRPAGRFSDLTVNAIQSGDVTRFVNPFSLEVKAKVRYQSLRDRQRFSSNIDQVIWKIQ